jgi:hypothetical protein
MIAVGLFVLAALPATAGQRPPHITGIYSDLRRDKETDDLDGTEIFIVGRYQRYFAFYEFWEGGSLPPVVVPITVRRNAISFTVPAPSGECGHYEGRISATGFDGLCSVPHPLGGANEQPVHLPRRTRSFWQ